MAASAFFPGSCAITFPRAALNEHGPGTTFGPNSPQSLSRDLLRLFSWPRRRNVPSLSARPACRPPRRTDHTTDQRAAPQAKDLLSAQARSVLTSRAVPCPPFLVQAPFLTQPRSSAAARAQNEALCQRRRTPSAAGKARMRGVQDIEPESPPLSGEPDADPNRPFFSGVCLVRRNAQRTKPTP